MKWIDGKKNWKIAYYEVHTYIYDGNEEAKERALWCVAYSARRMELLFDTVLVLVQ
jgi:hypothetical protein